MRTAQTLSRMQEHMQKARTIAARDLSDEVVLSALAMECFQAVNAAIDLAELLTAEKNLEFADTYKGTLENLERHRIIEPGTLKDLKELIYKRNLIAHEYHRIKKEELQDMIQKLHALERFAEDIRKAHKTKEAREPIEAYEPDEKIEKFLKVFKKVKGHNKASFAIYHGSSYEGRALPDSDIDICIYYEGTSDERWDYRLSLLKELPDVYDIQIFQDLPLAVRREVMKGKPVYVKDVNYFQQIVKETLNQYEAVRPRLARQLKEGEPGEIRIDLVHSKLTEAEDAIKVIEENLPQTYEEYNKLGIIKSGIYKETEHAIECVIDACAVINSDLSLGKPSDVDDILTNLVNAGILHKDMGGKIREMKRFRNVLVHKYGKIDDKQAYTDIKEGLTDIRSIIKDIRNILGIGNLEPEQQK